MRLFIDVEPPNRAESRTNTALPRQPSQREMKDAGKDTKLGASTKLRPSLSRTESADPNVIRSKSEAQVDRKKN